MKFIRNGSQHKPFPTAAQVVDQLPLGYHRVMFDPEQGFLLDQVPPMGVPSKVYGAIDTRVDRIYHTYTTRKGSTGVLLTGDKGGGKTMLARKVCARAVADGQPVIICDRGSAMGHPGFAHFLASLDFPFVALLDEFEKSFEKVADQASLLPLMDGLTTTRRLLILTCNEKEKISPYMINRPGRIFYSFEYSGLDDAVVAEYCADHGLSSTDVADLMTHARMTRSMSFDSMQSVVEEMKRYGLSFREAASGMNLGGVEVADWEVVMVMDDFLFPLKRSFRYALGQSDYSYANHRDVVPFARQMGMSPEKVAEVEEFFDKNQDDDGDVRLFFTPDNFIGFDQQHEALAFSQSYEGVSAFLRARARRSPLGLL